MKRKTLISFAVVFILVVTISSINIFDISRINTIDEEPIKHSVLSSEKQRTISLGGSAGAGTNYQVLLAITYDSDMQADFDDLRFYDNDGITPLDYWIESYVASTSAVVWVEVKDNLDSARTIYMHYGDPLATSESNGDNTFLYFDDFSTDTLSKTGSTISVSSDQLHWDSTTSYGDGEVTIPVTVDMAMNFHFNQDTAPNTANFYVMLRNEFGSAYQDFDDAWGLRFYDDDQDLYVINFEGGVSNYALYDTSITLDTDYYAQVAFSIADSDVTLDVFTDYWITTLGTQQSVQYDAATTESLDVLSFSTRNINGMDGEMDYIFLRNYITPEPTLISIGAESEFSDPEWHNFPIEHIVFYIPINQMNLTYWLMLGGLVMIPTSTLFLVKGGRSDMSRDKIFLFFIMFLFGWALFLGGIL